ncbi:caffeine-induced death protein 2-domain-containing protein [Aspergillus aurantiobrunneus]
MVRASSTPAPELSPQFCFNERLLRVRTHQCILALKPDFLSLSRSTIDDSITQNLNALFTPAREGFDPSSTAVRQTDSNTGRVIDPSACQGFKDKVLFPSWQTRSDVLTYCAGVATSPDPEDPDLILRQTESAKDRERVVDERLDPYSARFFPREARTESLANLVRNQRTVEEIIRVRTWGLVSERCGGSSGGWEKSLNKWRERNQQ